MFRPLGDIRAYIRSFYATAFKPIYFLLMVLMLSIIIYFNYFPRFTIDHAGLSWIENFGYNYFLYFIPFATAYIFQGLFFSDTGYLRSKNLWLIVLLAPAFFSFRVNFTFLQPLIKQHWQGEEKKYWLAILNLFTRAVVFIPVISFWWLKDRASQPLYGFKKTTRIQAYFFLLLMMLPLLVLASNNPGFLRQYPRALHATPAALPLQQAHWMLYEFFYAMDFFSIEFFFRGFLIIAFIRICGMRAIIPAACFYCCIHLGKPMPEAISSFFGGLLLGIISYHTKSIWGGLLIHVGIAAIMELLAFQHYHLL